MKIRSTKSYKLLIKNPTLKKIRKLFKMLSSLKNSEECSPVLSLLTNPTLN